jgi:Short C-terminal domain
MLPAVTPSAPAGAVRYPGPVAIEEARSPATTWVRRSLGIAVGLGGVACAMTVLFLSMRAVLDIGGSCATPGAYAVAHPCPDGVAGLTVGSVFLGLAAALVYAISLVPKGPGFLGLLWPALFLSLGWNFLDYGWNPPGGEGIVWGWMVCGILFVLMGAAPLLVLLSVRRLRGLLWGDDGPAGWRSEVPTAPSAVPGPPARPVLEWLGQERPSPNGSAHPGVTVDGTAPGDDVVSRLERLADLRRRGALSETEFETAKRDVLEGK